jgi:hypothetical protein
MMFHLALRTANLILQLPAGMLEGVVNSECQIGMALICRRRPFHIHFATVGKGETNVDRIQSAFAMTLTRSLQHNAACGYATPALLKLCHVGGNRIFDFRGSGHALKYDFRRRLHFLLPLAAHR